MSRANEVQILGGIHLKLLNNVNIKNLQWWENELDNWKAFKSGNVSKVVYRNNIHISNHRFATLHRRYLIVARASAPSAIHEGDIVDIDIDDEAEQFSDNAASCLQYAALPRMRLLPRCSHRLDL